MKINLFTRANEPGLWYITCHDPYFYLGPYPREDAAEEICEALYAAYNHGREETRLRNMTEDLRSALSAAAKTLMTEKHQKRLTELARQANIGRTKSALTLQRMRDAQRLRRQREASKNVGD